MPKMVSLGWSLILATLAPLPALADPTQAHAVGNPKVAHEAAAGNPLQPPTSLTDMERENLQLKIAADLGEQSLDLFTIVLSTSLAAFAALMTIIVIFFALRTKDAAVAEAKSGVEDFRSTADDIIKSIRTEFEVSKNEMETLLLSATTHTQAIRTMRATQEHWASEIAQFVVSEHSLSQSEQLTLDLRSSEAIKKTVDQFSPEDFFIMVANHVSQGNWKLAGELGTAMQLVAGREDVQISGAFYEGTAYIQIGEPEKAIDVFTKAIDRFSESPNADVRKYVVKCVNNRLVAMARAGMHDEILATLPACIALADTLPSPRSLELRCKFLINKGNALSRLGRNLDAIAVYDEVLSEARGLEEVERDARRASALYNKACAFAEMGRVSDAVTYLDKCFMIDSTYGKRVPTDSDFDSIRSKPTFKRIVEKWRLGVRSETVSTGLSENSLN